MVDDHGAAVGSSDTTMRMEHPAPPPPPPHHPPTPPAPPEEPTPEEHEAAKASLLSNLLAIVGVIILVVIVIWGIVHLASLSKSWFSSLFSGRAASIAISAPAEVTASTPFTVSWEYTPSETGSYAFLYQCQSSMHFETADASAEIPCGASLTLPPSVMSVDIKAKLTGKSSVSVPFSIIYVPSATSSTSVQGGATILVSPATSTPIVSTPTTPTAKPAAPTGPADLSVRIISVSADQSGNATAVFDIANTGSGASGTYHFEAQLPVTQYPYGTTQQAYKYTSPAQASLAPGDHIVSTLHFSGAQLGGVFSVTVDPAEVVNDSNRTNNYVYQTLSGPYYGQPYYTY